jgi:hypothetical protein
MKAKLFLLLAVFSSIPLFSGRSQTLVTFDNLTETGSGAWFGLGPSPQGYEGLTWDNIICYNAILATNIPAGHGFVNGGFYGMVSPSNAVALIGIPDPMVGLANSEIDSSSNFSFFSAYFTGGWNSNLNVEVQGFRDETNLVYDETKVVAATYPTLCTFNFLDVDRLYFQSYGGQPAFGQNGPDAIVMDNFMFEFIPEPSSLLLIILGTLTLCFFRRRSTT